MCRDWTFGLGSMVVGALIALAFGATADARDLTIPGATQRRAHIVTADAKPARVVTRHSVTAQPQPRYVHVVVGQQSHLIDVDANYLHQGQNRIDDNHWLIKAQRLAKSAMARPAQVIHGSPPAPPTAPAASETVVAPRLIIRKPGVKPYNPAPRKAQPKRGNLIVLAD